MSTIFYDSDEDQTVESFLWTLAIDMSMGVVLTGFFIFLRNKPTFDWCFATRTHYRLRTTDPWKRKAPPKELPKNVFKMIVLLYNISQEDELRIVGLDGVILLRFFRMGIKFFSFCMIFGLVVLLQVNLLGDEEVTTFNQLTIANVSTGSGLLWLHYLSVYLFTGVLLFMLYEEYRTYVYLRHRHYLVNPQRKNITSILVSGISSDLNDDNTFAEFFRSIYPLSYATSTVIKETSELEDTIANQEKKFWALDRSLFKLQHYRRHPPERCDYMPPKYEHVVEARDKLADLNMQVKELQSIDHHPSSVGFVTFTSLSPKIMALNTSKTLEPTRLYTEEACEPLDIIWKGLRMESGELLARSIVLWTFVILMIIFYMVPIAFFSSWTSLETLLNIFPWLESILSGSSFLTGLLQGWLPTAALVIFNVVLPLFLRILVEMFEGNNSESQIDYSVFTKYFIFQVFNYYLFTIVSGSLLSVLWELLDSPSSVLLLLASGIPSFSAYFIEYIFFTAVVLFPWRLLRVWPLVRGWYMKQFYAVTDHEIHIAEEAGCLRYGNDVPMYLLIFMVSLTYSTISPIVLPVAVVFFIVGYFTLRYHLVFVLHPLYENGGVMFPRLFSRVIIGAIVYQLTLIGYFIIKEAYYEGIFLIPLVLFTIIYHQFVKTTFSIVADMPTQAEITEFDSKYDLNKGSFVTQSSTEEEASESTSMDEKESKTSTDESMEPQEEDIEPILMDPLEGINVSGDIGGFDEKSFDGEMVLSIEEPQRGIPFLKSRYVQPCLMAPQLDAQVLFERYPDATPEPFNL